MEDTGISTTPNAELATIISNSLVEEGLVTKNQMPDLKAKLSSGKATAEDWRRWIEEGLDVSANNEAK